jgi:hypothetical protein
MALSSSASMAESAVVEAINLVKGVPLSNIFGAVTLLMLEIDSLDMLEIAMLVDEKCGTRIDEEQLRACLTVGEVVELVGSEIARVSREGPSS